jgi:NodT family efflux transporter outer membrane factor (OMF) lipoprotein
MRGIWGAAGRKAGSAAALLAAGCAVGPNFHRPAPPAVSSYVSDPADLAGGAAPAFDAGRDIPGDWWSVFQSKPLDALVERALSNSPDVGAARSALAAAEASLRAQRSAYAPAASASLTSTRSSTSLQISAVPASGARTFTLYTPEAFLSYTPDLFGKNSRAVEGATAQKEQARLDLAATHIALSANVASAVIQEASLDAQIDATRKLIQSNADVLRILRRQSAGGARSTVDVAAQETLLAQTEAGLPPLLRQLAQQRDLLAALIGALPNAALPERPDLDQLQLPRELPVTLPSRLVEQRPDVRAAEEVLHAASAAIGVARANRFPELTLTADAGITGIISSGSSGFWDLGAGLASPVVQGAKLRHQEEAARAAYDQAAAQYRATVVAAFQGVADALYAVRHDADALTAAAAAKRAASVSLDLATRQVQSGYVSSIELLTAQQAYQQAAIAEIQAQANYYLDAVALLHALGGGWWNRTDLPVAPDDRNVAER